MAHGLPRTRFDSASLVRVLTDLVAADVPESRQPFAERIGQWLPFNDALALYSALNAGAVGAAELRSAGASPEQATAVNALARVRGVLAESIVTDGVSRPGKARIALPTPAPEASAEEAADFTPYRRYYLAHQREMSASIASLRGTVRAALSRHSTALKRLAVLDAVLDQGLAARERDLLATVPTLVARRFEQRYEAHRAAASAAGTADDPGRWMEPGGWLAAFCAEMQSVLLAELELRLQPVAGLVAALEQEITGKQ